MHAQVAAVLEPIQHGLDLRQHRGIVRVGADAAKDFVQPLHSLRTAHRSSREVLEQRKLRARRLKPELETQTFQGGKGLG